MQWESWQAFWAMGGRSGFVWGSYGVTFLLILLELFLLWRRQKATIRKVRQIRGALMGNHTAPRTVAHHFSEKEE